MGKALALRSFSCNLSKSSSHQSSNRPCVLAACEAVGLHDPHSISVCFFLSSLSAVSDRPCNKTTSLEVSPKHYTQQFHFWTAI